MRSFIPTMMSAAAASILWMAAGPVATAAEKFSFNVDVTLSKKALARLAAQKEGIIVAATYYGDPKPSAKKHANEVGQIDLAPHGETVELPGSGGRAAVSGSKIDHARLAWLSGPAQVNVNVYSARKSSDDNLLSCDFVDGALADVVKAPVSLHCTLIGEGAEVKRKP